jgi:magnesium chelatase family protein
MLAQLRTSSLLGIEALPVDVEVDVSPGALPKTVLVGCKRAPLPLLISTARGIFGV